MLPLTGPFVTSKTSNTTWEYKSSYRQKPPFNVISPFVVKKGWASTGLVNPGYAWSAMTLAESRMSDEALYAKAYANVVSQLGENAGVGISLTQWRQADSMIRTRANTLSRFTSALVRRSPLGIARSLGISVKRAQKTLDNSKYKTAKGLSGLWLEFWFGWKPMVQDIYAASEVFDNFIPWASLSGSASRPLYYKNIPPLFSFLNGQVYSGKAVCKIGIDVRLVNPNVRLLNQFGLLNPASVAWDAVPWSFVIDWFANTSQWLASFTDFAGFETSNGYITRMAYIEGRFVWPDYPSYGGPMTGVSMTRETLSELPRPRLMLKEWSMKPARALTALTLLTQKLPHH